MNYRKMKKCGDSISVLGFGCMRFPENSNGKIDIDRSTRMIFSAMDAGVNYFDTAYPYHNGQSEIFLGEVLKNGSREKINLATKLPSWEINTFEDMDKFFNLQLKRLETDYIDYYLIHALEKAYWPKLAELKLFDFIEKLKSDGKIRHIGFSFHDELSLFENIISAYDWDFCQIQYNYANETYQAGRRGMELAAEKGIDVIIMEPLLGGKLSENVPDDVNAIWNEASVKRTAAEWALKWLWNQSQVDIVLSGMSSEEQVNQNIEYASRLNYADLSEKESLLIDRVKKIYMERIKIPCTSCKYCMPCPHGVNIPECFRHVNTYSMFNNFDKSKGEYNWFLNKKSRASNCIECGECEQKCPQHIEIIKSLKETVQLFGE